MTKEDFCRCLKKRQKLDHDAVCAITGDEGDGKSTLAIILALGLDKDFNMQDSMIYTPETKEIEDKVRNNKINVLVVDEAIKSLYKMYFQNKTQKYLNQLYTLCRKENKITLLCIPRFRDLNEFFRNHRVKFWIHILARGYAVVFVRDWSPFTKDSWWMDFNQKIIDISPETRGKKIASLNLHTKLKIMSRSKNYLTTIEFGQVTDEAMEEYNELVESKKYVGLGGTQSEEELGVHEKKYKERLKRVLINLYLKHDRSYKKVGELLNFEVGAIKDLIRLDVPKRELKRDNPNYIFNKEKEKKKSNFLGALSKELKAQSNEGEESGTLY